KYRLVFSHAASERPRELFGKYIDVTPPSRRVWQKDEGGEGRAGTTVTVEGRSGKTRVVLHDRYPTKDAVDEALASQGTSGFSEQFEQLDALLVTLGASIGRS